MPITEPFPDLDELLGSMGAAGRRISDIDACEAITEWVLKETFAQLYYANVAPEGMILKPNMVISGMKAEKRASVEEVAGRTVKVLKRCVPPAVPGIAFLSGGQSEEEATAQIPLPNVRAPPQEAGLHSRAQPEGEQLREPVRRMRIGHHPV